MMALIPTERFNKSNWIEYLRNHCFIIKNTKPNTLLLGDSIVDTLMVWNEYFALINALNLGIEGDRVEYVLWRAIDLPLLSSIKMLLFYAEPIISQLILISIVIINN